MQITLKNVTKRFGETVAVNDLSITLASGKLTALLGPSGCGKTTTLNMLSGILPVTSGKVFFDEQDVTNLPPENRNIGLVFQNYSLYPHMTVLQNICFPMEMKKIPKKERIERAEKLAELVHISALLKRKPAELSGGQQQRVAIARALAKEPQVLLLDEPLSNLDAKLRIEMREEIKRIQREAQITTVFVTHDQEEASSIADEVVVLKDGLLQQQGSARSIYDQPNNLFVADFLGTPPINKITGRIVGDCIAIDGSEIKLPVRLQQKLKDGLPVVLAVRAESIVARPKEALFEVSVLERYSLGKDELIRFSVGRDQQMRGFVPSELEVMEGESLPLALKSQGVFLFDAESGERYA
ncbi:MAG: ABC transporter ATP-binding protein [Firmicutes bacterium]|nr:ABC transporter ATP-binding protein [Bacillota bacterium]